MEPMGTKTAREICHLVEAHLNAARAHMRAAAIAIDTSEGGYGANVEANSIAQAATEATLGREEAILGRVSDTGALAASRAAEANAAPTPSERHPDEAHNASLLAARAHTVAALAWMP